MAYTAMDKVRAINKDKYNISGPIVPEPIKELRIRKKNPDGSNSIDKIPRTQTETLAIEFIRESCEGLRFSEKYESCEDNEGKSLGLNQIPYNMEKDIDRLCFETAVHKFMESGHSKDAFDVYFCFIEMFLGEYRKTRAVIEMLSDFENTSGSLLMKHRDHYSHSAYVFIMGLAFYQSSLAFRKAYERRYGEFIEKEKLAPEHRFGSIESCQAAHFLKYWGMASLFHDIGYPFELTFEQMKSYFGNTIDHVPFVSFNINNYVDSMAEDILKKAEELRRDIIVELAENSKSRKECRRKLIDKTDKLMKETLFAAAKGECEGSESASGSDEDKYKLERCIEKLDTRIAELKQRKEDDEKKIDCLLPKEHKGSGITDLNVYLSVSLSSILEKYYGDFSGFRDFQSETVWKETKHAVEYKEYLYDVLCRKCDPKESGGYIDHAYFSAIQLLACFLRVLETDELNEMYTNSITAIIMHNSLYKFSVTNYKSEKENRGKHLRMEIHPLAFLLMLCDELQCWDRTSHGRISRSEVHPFYCEFEFDPADNKDNIKATYFYDKKAVAKYIKRNPNLKGKTPEAYVKDKTKHFLSDIKSIVSINKDKSFDGVDDDIINGNERLPRVQLSTKFKLKENNRYHGAYLSSNSYINFYRFAVLLFGEEHCEKSSDPEKNLKNFEEKFNDLSLEYKLIHLSRIKKFAKYLNSIGCFYSDKVFDMESLDQLKDTELEETIGPLEHERWCWEHYIMGWRYGTEYENQKDDMKIVRELTRTHKCLPESLKEADSPYSDDEVKNHFYELDKIDKNKNKNYKNNDMVPMKIFLEILTSNDGVKLYRFKREDEKKD